MKKLMIIAVMLMIAMASTASAGITHTARIYDELGNGLAPNPVVIKPGESIILSYHAEAVVSDSIGTTTPYGFQVLSASNGGSVGDLNMVFANDYTPTSSPVYEDNGVMTLSLDADAPEGAVYEFKVFVGNDIVTSYASASRELTAIPEFPTIALPIAAILGLAFFMQRRKEE